MSPRTPSRGCRCRAPAATARRGWADPLTTFVAVPATTGGGTVTVAESSATQNISGYVLFGQEVRIVSTAATDASHPLRITFGIDSSFLPATIFKDGVAISASCQ